MFFISACQLNKGAAYKNALCHRQFDKMTLRIYTINYYIQ